MATRRTADSVPLDRLCELRNPEDIARLVPQGSRNYALLEKGVEIARSHFPDAGMSIVAERDIEEPDFESIFLEIAVEGDWKTASDVYDNMYESGWLDIFSESKGLIVAVLEFE